MVRIRLGTKSLSTRPARDLGARVEAELVQDVAHVHAGCPFGNHQSLGNLAVSHSFKKKRSHLELPTT